MLQRARMFEEPSAVIINWTPLQLAIGYVVEMRPAGTKADWSPVDVGGPVEPGYFSQSCSSCKVSGLRPGFAYEARVTYISSCSCRSEASDASAPCAPCGGYQVPREPSYQMPASVSPVPPAPGRAKGCNQGYPGLSTPTWRCVHGTVVPPPSVPEVLAGDEASRVKDSELGVYDQCLEGATLHRFGVLPSADVNLHRSTPSGKPTSGTLTSSADLLKESEGRRREKDSKEREKDKREKERISTREKERKEGRKEERKKERKKGRKKERKEGRKKERKEGRKKERKRRKGFETIHKKEEVSLQMPNRSRKSLTPA
eukprot:Skav210704  [mRNA]  locus=scaffold1240:156833:162958:- [translate_table: standard]